MNSWLVIHSILCHSPFKTTICAELGTVHLKPLNFSFYSRKMCGHHQKKSHGSSSKERRQNTTNQKLLVSTWGSRKTVSSSGAAVQNHRQQTISCGCCVLLNEFQKNETFPEEGSEGWFIPQWEIFTSLFSMVSYSTKLLWHLNSRV